MLFPIDSRVESGEVSFYDNLNDYYKNSFSKLSPLFE